MSAGWELEFTDPAGEALRIEWAPEALADLDPGAERPPWRLGGELDWDELEALRIVSGRLEDGALLAIAALRPAGAGGHGEELVAGALGDGEGVERLAEALLSTEYDASGAPSRIGLELLREDGGLPLRVAGLAGDVREEREGGLRRVIAPLALRSGGAPGVGRLDVLDRG